MYSLYHPLHPASSALLNSQEESGSLTSGSGLDLMGERDGEFGGLEDEGEEGAHELASDDSANDF